VTRRRHARVRYSSQGSSRTNARTRPSPGHPVRTALITELCKQLPGHPQKTFFRLRRRDRRKNSAPRQRQAAHGPLSKQVHNAMCYRTGNIKRTRVVTSHPLCDMVRRVSRHSRGCPKTLSTRDQPLTLNSRRGSSASAFGKEAPAELRPDQKEVTASLLRRSRRHLED